MVKTPQKSGLKKTADSIGSSVDSIGSGIECVLKGIFREKLPLVRMILQDMFAVFVVLYFPGFLLSILGGKKLSSSNECAPERSLFCQYEAWKENLFILMCFVILARAFDRALHPHTQDKNWLSSLLLQVGLVVGSLITAQFFLGGKPPTLFVIVGGLILAVAIGIGEFKRLDGGGGSSSLSTNPPYGSTGGSGISPPPHTPDPGSDGASITGSQDQQSSHLGRKEDTERDHLRAQIKPKGSSNSLLKLLKGKSLTPKKEPKPLEISNNCETSNPAIDTDLREPSQPNDPNRRTKPRQQ